MDHARKIGKTNKPMVWSHEPSLASSTCGKATSMDDEDTGEDCRLVNWRKWLKDREKHYRHYEKLCARERDDLLMVKDLEDFRRKSDEVPMLGKSIFDKHRVPAFWVTPEMLPKHGHPDWPDIPVTLTANRTGQSTTERVGLPELIRREKGLTISREQSAVTDASEKKNLTRKIQRLRATAPDIEKLAIKGEKWAGKRRKKVAKKCGASFASLRTIKSDDGSQSDVVERERDLGVVLVIQDRQVTPNRPIALEENNDLPSNQLVWSFKFKSTTGQRVGREIRLENRGNSAIVYRWRHENQSDTNTLLHPPQNSPFFFNKNKGLVLPDQKVKLLVWFRSQVPRVATELWILKTEPPVYQESLIFRFWGIATSPSEGKSSLHQNGSSNQSRCEVIEKYLDRRIRDVQIHEIIESIVENVDREVLSNSLDSYVGFFLEREIFVAKNPYYFWHSELIREFRQIYDQATSHDSPQWSLSLIDLRTILLKIQDPQVRTESLLRFNQLARQSLRSSFLQSTGSSSLKQSIVYNLLCSFANQFEEESKFIASKCSLLVSISNETIPTEAPEDIWKSKSISSLSLRSTPRKKSRKKSLSGQSKPASKISMSTNNLNIAENGSDEKIAKSCLLYKEVLHVTVREILSNTIMAICAVLDSDKNFNHPNK